MSDILYLSWMTLVLYLKMRPALRTITITTAKMTTSTTMVPAMMMGRVIGAAGKVVVIVELVEVMLIEECIEVILV